MAKKAINPLEQHVDKLVLGVCVLLLLGSTVYFLVLGTPYQVDGFQGERIGPSGIGEALLATGRAQVERWKTLPPPTPAAAPVEGDKGRPFPDLNAFSDVRERLTNVQAPPLPLVVGERPTEVRKRPLVGIIAPGRPFTSVQRNVLKVPAEATLQDVVTKGAVGEATQPWGDARDGVYWTICAATVDLSAQEKAFKDADYPPALQDLTIYDVQLQRRRVVADDVFESWRPVSAWVPFVPPSLPPCEFAEDGTLPSEARDALDSLWSLLRRGQRFILRPDAPRAEGGTRFVEPQIPYLHVEPAGFYDPNEPRAAVGDPRIPAEARAWASQAEKMAADAGSDLNHAYVLAEAAYYALGISETDRKKYQATLDALDAAATSRGIQPPKRGLRRRMPIVAYDLSLPQGASYQYRIRLRALNRLAGKPYELADAADARKVLIDGAWSPPGPVVEAQADTYMYVARPLPDKKEVSIEVFSRNGKAYESKKFTVAAGDYIGKLEKSRKGNVDYSTGAMVVDIDFEYLFRTPGGAEQKTTRVVCTDPANPGGLKELILARDESDPKRKQLAGG